MRMKDHHGFVLSVYRRVTTERFLGTTKKYVNEHPAKVTVQLDFGMVVKDLPEPEGVRLERGDSIVLPMSANRGRLGALRLADD